MRITWKDGVTTLAVAAAVVLERAYFHNWDWPLVSNMKWVIAGLGGLMFISFVFGYLLDELRGLAWSVIAGVIGAGAAVVAAFGLANTDSDYVTLLMLMTVLFWMASMLRHVTVHTVTPYHQH